MADYERSRGRGSSFELKALHVHSEVDEAVDAALTAGASGAWTDAEKARFAEELADVFLSSADFAAWSNDLGVPGLLAAAEAKVEVLRERMAVAPEGGPEG